MIDEQLQTFALDWHQLMLKSDKHPPQPFEKLQAQALTAIYEIGLEVIGADETLENDFVLASVNRLARLPANAFNRNPERRLRNELRASQRKAWALKCNIKEGE